MENPKRILVTGGAGFVGSNLIKRLVAEYPDSEIISVDNYFTGNKDTHVEGVEYLEMSVLEYVNSVFEHPIPDLVFHFGEYSRIVKSFDDIDYIIDTNLYSTSLLIEKCKTWGSKLIYSASSSRFGNDGKDENLSPYSWAKAKMVELIKNYGDWYGLKYEIVYFFNVFGPGQIEKGDYATVVGIFERQYKNGKKLTVVHPGTQSRDFTHIDDIVEGTLLVSKRDMNKSWHLRTGIDTTIIELAQMFNCEYEIVPERRGERFSSEPFFSDTEEVLGWKPKTKLKNYIKTIIKEKNE